MLKTLKYRKKHQINIRSPFSVHIRKDKRTSSSARSIPGVFIVQDNTTVNMNVSVRLLVVGVKVAEIESWTENSLDYHQLIIETKIKATMASTHE